MTKKINFIKTKGFLILFVFLCSLFILIGNTTNIIPKKFIPQINLGIDIKGGREYVMQSDFYSYKKEKFISILNTLRSKVWLPDSKINNVKLVENNDKISIEIDTTESINPSEIANEMQDWSDIVEVRSTKNKTKHSIFIEQSKDAQLQSKLSDIVIGTLQNRLDVFGKNDIKLIKFGNDKIIIKVPHMENFNSIENIISKTAKIEFIPVVKVISESEVNAYKSNFYRIVPHDYYNGAFYVLDTAQVVQGNEILDSRPQYNPNSFKFDVMFRMSNTGATKFARITQASVGKQVAILLDNKIISAPFVNEPIITGSGVISSKFTSIDEANELSKLIKSGSLPIEIKKISQSNIEQSTGSLAFSKILKLSVLSIFIVFCFIAILYKRSGVIASVSLILNILLTLSCFAIFGFTINLPGVVAFALNIGMAIDINVIIFESIKQEMKSSKNISQIVSNAYAKSSSAILDSHITTIVSAAFLFYFGFGFVRGFAVSLIIGILCSMFSCVFVTKYFISKLIKKQIPLF